jgi:hypothetical protein
MFTYHLLNPDGTPADKPTFRSSEPDWHVSDKVLNQPRRRVPDRRVAGAARGRARRLDRGTRPERHLGEAAQKP